MYGCGQDFVAHSVAFVVVNEHHAPILEAIRQRDPDTSEALMRDHIDLSFSGLKHFLAK
jgi:DNA-binding GntR family transcriptional regulator